MKAYQNFQTILGNRIVRCLNCGAINASDRTTCEQCEATLVVPQSLFVNVIETVIQPFRAMFRIAATLPIMQGFLVVVALASLNALQSLYYAHQYYSYIVDHPEGRNPEFNKLLAKFQPPQSFVLDTIFPFVSAVLYWFMFTAAIYVTGRLFYSRNPEFKNSFLSLLAIVAFSRLGELLTLLFSLVAFFYPDLYGIGSKVTSSQFQLEDKTTATFYLQPIADQTWRQVVEAVANLGQLLWKVFLMMTGVHFATGLNWNRAILVVLIPAMLFLFFLRIPF